MSFAFELLVYFLLHLCLTRTQSGFLSYCKSSSFFLFIVHYFRTKYRATDSTNDEIITVCETRSRLFLERFYLLFLFFPQKLLTTIIIIIEQGEYVRSTGPFPETHTTQPDCHVRGAWSRNLLSRMRQEYICTSTSKSCCRRTKALDDNTKRNDNGSEKNIFQQVKGRVENDNKTVAMSSRDYY